MPEHRSGCPINLATEVLGDKWTLVVLRDLMFGNKRYYRELLHNSLEGIASNILADRLQRLVTNGLVSPRSRPDAQAEDPLQPHRAGHSARADHGPPRLVGKPAPTSQPRACRPRLSFSRPAAPNCGIGLWTSYASDTSASPGRPVQNPCSPISKPPTRPASPSDPSARRDQRSDGT